VLSCFLNGSKKSQMVTQYDDLMFRIDLIPQGEDLLKAFPRLSKYPEFNP